LQAPRTAARQNLVLFTIFPFFHLRLLQTAAVIGTEVPLALLQAIADVPEEALYRHLAHL
jgi:hypothetical protein